MHQNINGVHSTVELEWAPKNLRRDKPIMGGHAESGWARIVNGSQQTFKFLRINSKFILFLIKYVKILSWLMTNSYFVSHNLQTEQKLYINNIHMYDHIGVCMGVKKLVLADSRDEPSMQDSWVGFGQMAHSSSIQQWN